MSDDQKKPRPASRRPSYLTGPVGSVRPVPASALPEVAPKAGEARKEQEEVKEDHELYTWKVWLFPRRPLVSAAVVVALFALIALAYWAFPNPFFVSIISVILVNRLAPYLFPVKYVLTEQTVGYRTFLARDVRNWERIFTFYDYPDGVLLANDTRTMRGRLREGLFLYYEPGGTNRDDVLNVVNAKLKTPKEAMAPKEERDYKGGVSSAFRRIRKLRGKH